jgi:glycosyltransferase involved in cell wall biosynthesis
MANFSSPINTSIKSILTSLIKRIWSANTITRKQIFKNTKTEIRKLLFSLIKSMSTRYYSHAASDKSTLQSVLVQIELCSTTADALSVIEVVLAQTIRPSAIELIFNTTNDRFLFDESDLSTILMSSGIKHRSFIHSRPRPNNVAGSAVNDQYRQLDISHIFKIDSKSELRNTSIEDGLTILQSFRAVGLANFRTPLYPVNSNPNDQSNLESLLVELPESLQNKQIINCINLDSRPISVSHSSNRNSSELRGSRILFIRRKSKIIVVFPDRKIGIKSLMSPFRRYPVLNLVKSYEINKGSTQLPSLCIFVPSLKMDGGAERFIETLMIGLKGSLKSIFLVATDLNSSCINNQRPSTFSQQADFVYHLEENMHPEDFANFVNHIGTMESKMHYVNVGSQWLYRYLNSHPVQLIGSGKLIDVLFNSFGSLPQHATVKHSFTDTVFVYSALESYARENHLASGQLHTIYVGIGRDSPVKRIANNNLIIGWLGRFSPEKRPEWFVELAKIFDGDALFKMAGTGDLFASIQKSFSNIQSLEILGFVDDTKSFLQSINLLVITSEMEGVSLSAMEAINSGIPVISTDVGGMSDLIINGVNGWLVPSNFMSLASSIGEILADKEGFWKVSDLVGARGLNSMFDENYMLESFKSLFN